MKEIYLVLLFCLFTVGLCPFLIHISNQFNLCDTPNYRKIHSIPVPYTGGFLIILSIIIGLLFIKIETLLLTLSIFAFLFFFLGFLDDYFDFRPLIKLIFQILLTGIFLSLPMIHNYWIIICKFKLINFFINLFWMLLIINAFNLIDGVDGLALMITIIALSCFIIFAKGKMIGGYYMLFIILGSMLGLIRYNISPAKIFLGDNGSLLIGFLVASYSMIIISKMYVTYSIFAPITVILIPILDVFMVSLKRIKNKTSIFKADKNHIHHELLSLGFSQREVLMILGIITSFFSILTVLHYNIKVFLIFAFLILIIDAILIFIKVFDWIDFKSLIIEKNLKFRNFIKHLVEPKSLNGRVKILNFVIIGLILFISIYSYSHIQWNYPFFIEFMLFLFILILNNFFHLNDDTTKIFSNFIAFWLYLFICYEIYQCNQALFFIIFMGAIGLNILKIFYEKKFDLFLYNPLEIIIIHLILILYIYRVVSLKFVVPAFFIYNLTKNFYNKDAYEFKIFYPLIIVTSFMIPLLKIIR